MSVQKHEPGASIWTSGLILAAFAAICTALVAFTHQFTAQRIADNAQAFLEQSLAPVIAGIPYDGKLTESTIVIPPPHELPGNGPATIYRVYSDDKPVAALFVVTARDGYSGPIRLLIGIDSHGVLTRVRVLEHRETPGLGDLIEESRSDWIHQFDHRSLDAPPREKWLIKRDGGDFDQLTGASITPRSIIKAIKETLLYFEAHGEEVFAVTEPSVTEPAQ
jgi:electron transport complex protein RnfG